MSQHKLKFTNNSSQDVWLAATGSSGIAAPDKGGWYIAKGGGVVKVNVEKGWSGRFWGRTGCTFDANNKGSCLTGDCKGNGLYCGVPPNGGPGTCPDGKTPCEGCQCCPDGTLCPCAIGTGCPACPQPPSSTTPYNCTAAVYQGQGASPPVTLIEFTFDTPGGVDNYDVSAVNGLNLNVRVGARNPQGTCGIISPCTGDFLGNCPSRLQVKDSSGTLLGCLSQCDYCRATGNKDCDQYCCSGDYDCSPANTAACGCGSGTTGCLGSGACSEAGCAACDASGNFCKTCSDTTQATGTCPCDPSKWPSSADCTPGVDCSSWFKSQCPGYYSYAFDDKTSDLTCNSTDASGKPTGYSIIFSDPPSGGGSSKSNGGGDSSGTLWYAGLGLLGLIAIGALIVYLMRRRGR